MLGLAEVAAFLGISRQRALQLADEGILGEPFARAGSRRFWLPADIERVAATRRTAPGRPRIDVLGEVAQ